MKKLINGIHHISMNTADRAAYERARDFYTEILGLSIRCEWDAGCMIEAGGAVVEIINNGKAPLPQGVLRHFAFAVDDVDACAEAVRAAGYEITTEPKDVVIHSAPELPIRIAFCIGPLGEEIEFFCEK